MDRRLEYVLAINYAVYTRLLGRLGVRDPLMFPIHPRDLV